jgi:hypothetical protein
VLLATVTHTPGDGDDWNWYVTPLLAVNVCRLVGELGKSMAITAPRE